MAFTIGGKPIVLDVDSTVRSWLDTYQPLRFLSAFCPHSENRSGNRSGNFLDIGLPLDLWNRIPDLGINELYWPTGAMRFALGYFLMRRADVESLAESPFQTAVPVVLQGPDTFQASMYLGWRPITSVGQSADTDLVLAILVDERFWWQGKNVGAITFGESHDWSDLFTTIGSELGTTVSPSEISSDYLAPDRQELERKYDSAAMMLDAIANSLNQRVVRAPNGQVVSMSWLDAVGVVESNLSNTANYVIAGGEIAGQAVPEKVVVVFQGLINHIPCGHGQYKHEATPPGGFSGQTVTGMRQTIYTTCYADYTTNGLGGEPDNESNLITLGDRVGADYYERFLKSYDCTFQGIKQWVPSAFDDFVLYRIGVEPREAFEGVGRVCTTRVVSLPYNGHPETNLCQDSDVKVLTADSYIAKPNNEIDPRSDTTPGSGEATVYDVSSGDLVSTGINDFLIYNPGSAPLSVGEYYDVHIDEFCRAFAVTSSGSSSTYTAGCGIEISGENKISTDTTALAGVGLKPAEEGCALDIDYGCGLSIENGYIRFSNISVDGDGLKADLETCHLHVDPGCGLLIDEDDKVAVDVSDLAGDGLKPSDDALEGKGCELTIDYGCGLTISEGKLAFDASQVVSDGLEVDDVCKIKLSPGAVEHKVELVSNVECNEEGGWDVTTVILKFDANGLFVGAE